MKRLVLSLPEKRKMVIPCPDALGRVPMKDGTLVPMQEALDRAYTTLEENLSGCRYLWDLNAVKRWSGSPATEAQLRVMRRRCRGFDTEGLTKGQASQILNRVMNGGKAS